jgi:hypothetical protein
MYKYGTWFGSATIGVFHTPLGVAAIPIAAGGALLQAGTAALIRWDQRDEIRSRALRL